MEKHIKLLSQFIDLLKMEGLQPENTEVEVIQCRITCRNIDDPKLKTDITLTLEKDK